MLLQGGGFGGGNDWYFVLATLGMALGGIWGIFKWVNSQLKLTVNMILDKMDKLQAALVSKVEYHEQHDDKRFESVSNELWAIKIRNASIDAAKRAKEELNKKKD